MSQAYYALDVPPAPPGAPEYLERLLARLQSATDAGSPRVARECLRDTIGFLSRYFSQVLEASSRRLGLEAQDAFGATLSGLLRTADPLAEALRSVFYREQLSGEHLPYPHTRLLQRDGWLATGAHTLSEWLQTSCEPESDDSCREEVDALLPVLSQWLAAAGPFFAECRYDYVVTPPPSYAFQAVGLRGAHGGKRVPMERVQLVTSFRDLQAALALRTRDREPAPAPLDTAPLAELVRAMLEQEAPVVVPPPAPEVQAVAVPVPVVTEPVAVKKAEFDFVMTAAPGGAGAVLLYLLLLAL